MGVRPHVVIVGAGFGGLAVARGLDKLPVEVTLVDRQNFTTFQPLLYQVATSGLNAADVAHPIRGLFHRQRNLRVRRGEVVGVDWDAPTSSTSHDERDAAVRPPRRGRRRRGHVVRRAGRRASTPPRSTRSTTPCGCGTTCSSGSRPPTPTPTSSTPASSTSSSSAAGRPGSRPPGALAELFSVVFKRDYPALGVGRARVVLVEARDALLGPFHASSQRAALDTLRARQVEVRLDETVGRGHGRPRALRLGRGAADAAP